MTFNLIRRYFTEKIDISLAVIWRHVSHRSGSSQYLLEHLDITFYHPILQPNNQFIRGRCWQKRRSTAGRYQCFANENDSSKWIWAKRESRELNCVQLKAATSGPYKKLGDQLRSNEDLFIRTREETLQKLRQGKFAALSVVNQFCLI